jgi:hypothetical protein
VSSRVTQDYDHAQFDFSGQPVPTNELMLAEIASFQLEFRALSYWTKKVEYSQAVSDDDDKQNTHSISPLIW